ncbi:hypothetical protein FKR81_08765 [Lentzea tibetensis]|uniref:Uncharacterized protein n=1 Tax=Lentzea tibetensis TaxID=2591470 RepID=A0A563EXN4_9PSEU|nr:hypothetical protein [Lentzea tibetensis]TWP52419.1 hypothetical protein FKR81_08765 [Lentzea tibetensis]
MRYQDESGRRATAVVRPVEGGVRLEGSDFTAVHLSVTQADRLREALRAAVFDLDRLDENDLAPVRAVEIPEQRSKSITREGDADTYYLG